MMHEPVSVLMSVYNGAPFLREAVDSILGQTFPDFEFVVVNDGSTDATAEILDSYGDPRLKVSHIANIGLPAALNFGLERCTYNLIIRMDADDIAYPHRFEALLRDWEEAGRPDVFGSGADYINEDGVYLWGVTMPLEDEAIKTVLRAPHGMSIMHPTVLMRKDAVLACGAYDGYFRNGQDYDLWLRMASRCRFGNSPQRLLKYRFNGFSDTARSIRVGDGEIWTGNWMRLLSWQKQLLIDAGEEEYWNACRDRIIKGLRSRIDTRMIVKEAVTMRLLTEAKILFYSGKRMDGLLQLAKILVQYPKITLKWLVGRKMTDISHYLLSPAEIKQIATRS